jgi:cytoskeleton protein RodZ
MPNEIAEIAMEYDTPSGATQVGAGLREVRERLGWKLPDVAAQLNIRLPYLEAIERGDLAALPGPAYQTGFVRSYAQMLGLDAEEILRRFRAEGSIGTVPKPQLSFPAAVPDRAVPTGAIVMICIVVGLAGYGLWYRHTEIDRRLAASVPSVPAELAPLALPPKPVTPPAAKPAPPAATPKPPAVATPPTAATSAPGTVVPSPAQPATPAPASAASPAPTASPAPAASPTPPPAPAAAAPAAPAPVATAPAVPATPPASVPNAGMTIVATADSWIEVRDATGNILFSKLLHAGQSWPVPDEAGLTMTTGNAGGTEISTNGKAGPPLGATGVVLHGYALTPAASPSAPQAATP